MDKTKTRLEGDLLGRWMRLVNRLEELETEFSMGGDSLGVDWSDIYVLNAYLAEEEPDGEEDRGLL